MSLFSSLERSAGSQFVSQTRQSRVKSRFSCRNRMLRSSTSQLPGRPGPRHSFGPASSIADVFINSLVLAGFCRDHRPNGRRFSIFSRHQSLASGAHELQKTRETSAEEFAQTHVPDVPPNSTTPRGQNGMPKPMPSRKPQTSRTTGGGLMYRPLMPAKPADPRAEQQLDDIHQQIHQSHRKDHSRRLYDFLIGTLGEEEGMKCLQVMLLNPEREICLPRERCDDGPDEDAMEVHGVQHLVSLLAEKGSSNQMIFRAYKELPSPGVSYLSWRSRGRLLHRFASPIKRRPVDSMRYLTLIDDMTASSLYISRSLWTAAIHLAGKTYTRVKRSDLQSALGVWRRMEHYNVDSNSVTFNILFDIAIKAGQFKVADKIMKEMQSRGLDFSRFGRVARIFLRGLQRDANGVRDAYHDFIRSGEVVDTVVLNCVMASLIRAGEYAVAEQMYERMKDAHKGLPKGSGEGGPSVYPSPSDNYVAYRKSSKRLGLVLGMTAYLHDKLPDHHRALQATLPLTPDAKTFHIFLSYHANYSGDLPRFMALLDDMEKTFSIPPQGMVYIYLFQGFATHGGTPDSQWTLHRLKGAWQSFLRALHNSKAEESSKRRTKLRKARLTWENPLRGTNTTADLAHASEGTSLFTPNEPDEISEAMDNRPRTLPVRSLVRGLDDESDDDWRYENEVYVGRRLVVLCLRAFSACGGPDHVIEVWSQIERLWRPESLKMSDIGAVKTVLRQLVPSGDKYCNF